MDVPILFIKVKIHVVVCMQIIWGLPAFIFVKQK